MRSWFVTNISRTASGEVKRKKRSRPTVKREVVDRRIPDLRLRPEQAIGALRVVGEAPARLDEAVSDPKGRMKGRSQRLEEALDRFRVEELIVPVRLEAHELRRHRAPLRDRGPRGMPGLGACREVIRRLDGAMLHTASCADTAPAVEAVVPLRLVRTVPPEAIAHEGNTSKPASP